MGGETSKCAKLTNYWVASSLASDNIASCGRCVYCIAQSLPDNRDVVRTPETRPPPSRSCRLPAGLVPEAERTMDGRLRHHRRPVGGEDGVRARVGGRWPERGRLLLHLFRPFRQEALCHMPPQGGVRQGQQVSCRQRGGEGEVEHPAGFPRPLPDAQSDLSQAGRQGGPARQMETLQTQGVGSVR